MQVSSNVHMLNLVKILLYYCFGILVVSGIHEIATDLPGSHILFTALTSASSTHISIAVILGKICRLGLWRHIILHQQISRSRINLLSLNALADWNVLPFPSIILFQFGHVFRQIFFLNRSSTWFTQKPELRFGVNTQHLLHHIKMPLYCT